MALTNPISDTLKIPRGICMFAPSTAVDDGRRDLGEVKPFSISIASEKTSFVSARTGINEVKGTATVSVTRTGAMTNYSISAANLADFIAGSSAVVTQTADAVADEEINVIPDRYYQLGKSSSNLTGNRDVSSLVLTVDASTAWQADTVTALGDIVIPTSPNLHWYFASAIAGDYKTAAVTEPTWPTDGSTVVDDQVTWQDGGLITQVVDDDYELDATDGLMYITSDGRIYTAFSLWPSGATNQYIPMLASYNKTVASREQITTGDTISVDGELWIEEDVPRGVNSRWYFPDVTLTPQGDLTLISDATEYQGIGFDVTVNTPSDGTPAIYRDGQPY